eukprot:760781-Hanusia_phi.AAC.2
MLTPRCRRRDTFRIEQADTYHALLEADLPGAMRYDQLKAQNLSVSMTIKEIKAIFSGGSHSEVVLVVCLDEDTRILPLKTTVDRARDLTKIESSQVRCSSHRFSCCPNSVPLRGSPWISPSTATLLSTRSTSGFTGSSLSWTAIASPSSAPHADIPQNRWKPSGHRMGNYQPGAVGKP